MMTLNKILLISLASLVLAACGGGGGGGGGGSTPPATQDKNFTISLDSVSVTRNPNTNPENVAIDTSTVSTGQLTFTE
jgi:ABC-type glycerol-3-phosphate transport system substrate-binding protein